jgi:hypothetical protein
MYSTVINSIIKTEIVKMLSDTILSDFLNPRSFAISPPRVGKKRHCGVGEMAYGKIRVSNTKEQDPFKIP